MQELQDVMRENGLTSIPTIHNDKNPSGQFAMEGEGKVDLCVTVSLFSPSHLTCMSMTVMVGMGALLNSASYNCRLTIAPDIPLASTVITLRFGPNCHSVETYAKLLDGY